MFRRAFALLAGTLALAACGVSPEPAPRAVGRPAAERPSTAVPAGRAVALLAPLSGPNAERGRALANAAQLALSAPGSPRLDVRDTGGTPQGAASAAEAAIAGGAGLIIGPLTAQETAAVAAPARAAGVAVLAFTTDPAQAQPGVWTLGLTPGQQVRRMVAAAQAQGKTRFAAVLPESEFGRLMATALQQATSSAGLGAPDIHFHAGGMSSVNQAVRDVSQYASRRGPVDAQIRAARASRTAEGRRRAAELGRSAIPDAPMDALLLADTGETLAAISSLLPYYDLDPPEVRVLGPAIWSAPAARGEAGLGGAWFAAPDPASRAEFDAAYQAQFGGPAPGLADFAYDAASVARVLAAEGGFSVAGLVRPEGFAGVSGVFALMPDGSVRRGLALFEIRRGGPQVVEPAPDSLAAPGS
jgi:branched-chain amino acid transport system substrate-binding protein